MSSSTADPQAEDTLLSFFLKNVPSDALPTNPAPQTLHPFASGDFDDPLAVLKRIAQTTTTLESSINAYNSFMARDQKFISILRQSTTLISGLHTVSTPYLLRAIRTEVTIN